MAIDHLVITVYIDDGYRRASYSPANYTDGLIANGYFTYVSDVAYSSYDTEELYLLDGPYGQHENVIGQFTAQRGVKTSLGSAFPGTSLEGLYLYAESNPSEAVLITTPYTACTGPSWCSLDEELSRDAVTLRWGAGTPGTNNPIDHYEVWRAEMESPDAAYPEDWYYFGSTTSRSMDVNPPDTVGRYYLYSVWAVGANYNDISEDSEWCDSSNLLRRKWDAFGAWTDPTLTAGVSGIRALHLTQLQERIAVIRSFYGLSAYSFTAVTARKTKIATWAALIGELRSAVDGITTNHAAWNTLQAGRPRIAHITQLRDIIDNM